MTQQGETTEHALVQHAERQTKALEALVFRADIALFLTMAVVVLWLLAWLVT